MEQLSIQQLIDKIRARQPFTAEIDSGAFQVRIRRFVPLIATAIHNGHRVSDGLAAKMAVTENQRRFEEDPFTGAIAEDQDISISANDSRYCYDLNRRPELCIYERAWGRNVWLEPLPDEQRQPLLARHAAYYRVLDELCAVLVDLFGSAVLYDIHSYNYTRRGEDPPLFNIGSWFVDGPAFGQMIEHLGGELERIELPGIDVRVALNEVFDGKGYQAEYIHLHHPQILCIPLEVKKIFMDEQSFELNRDLFEALRVGVVGAIDRSMAFFRGSVQSGGGR